jgi:ABC-type sugar transport system substrate-binding protein
LLSLIAISAGCGDDPAGGGSDGDDRLRVAMLSFANNAAFNSYEIGAEKAAEDLGVDLEIGRANEFTAAASLQVLNAMVAKRPDTMLVSIQEAEPLQGPLEQFNSRGITIITYDSDSEDSSVRETYVSSQYVKLGRRTAEVLASLIDDQGKVVPFSGLPGNKGLEDHLDGFRQVMRTKPDIQLLPVQYNEFENTKTNAQLKAVLAAHPDLAGVYLGTTLDGGLGGIAALKQAEKLDEVATVSLDAFPEAIDELKQGTLDAVIGSKAQQIGYEAVKAAVDEAAGKELPDEILLDGCTITKATIDDPKNQPCILVAP